MKYGIPTSQGMGIFYFERTHMAQRLILIRHGDLGEGRRGRYIGRTDAPLSALGRRQAEALAGEFARMDGARILCSPLVRCCETARIALGPGAGFAIDADLREIDFGRWEGMSFAEIAAADPAAVDRWAALAGDFAFPGGEGIGEFRARVEAAAGRIAADPAEKVVAVTHGGVIRLMICLFLGLDVRHCLLFEVRPASVTELSLDGGKGVLTRLNDMHHFSPPPPYRVRGRL